MKCVKWTVEDAPSIWDSCGGVVVMLTYSGHSDHEEVDTVPVGQGLSVVKIWRIARVLQQVDDPCRAQPDRDEHGDQLGQPAQVVIISE